MQFYKVGGFVRDHLLNIKCNDIDWVVIDASPRDMVELGYAPVGKDFPVFLHPNTREEYALARKESKRGIGYRGFDFEVDNVTLEDDLFRRDITINAMAMDQYGIITDPYDGKADLHSKVIKHISKHFSEDPLRVLRIARFQAKLPDFTIHESTLDLMREIANSGELDTLTPERVNIELYKALKCDKPSLFFDVLKNVGALSILFPEVYNLVGVPQPMLYHPEGCAYTHTMIVMDSLPAEDLKLRLAGLCHDFGKAVTPEDVLPRHPAHEKNGLDIVNNFCDRLRVTKDHSRFCYLLTKNHIKVHTSLDLKPITVIRMIKDFRAQQNPQILDDIIRVCEADQMGKLANKPYPQGDYLRGVLKTIKETSFEEIKKGYSGSHIIDQIEQVLSKRVRIFKRQFNMNRYSEIIEQKDEIIKRMNANHPDKKLIGLIVAGSHFFSMDSENSDLDFRGVYLPYDKDTRRGQIQYKTSDDNSKNGKDDVDVDLYSVHKFLSLIGRGDFNMIEFLFAPVDKILIDTPMYKWLRSMKSSFLTKNISPFIGFIKKEYNRYGISGDHYNAQLKFLELIKTWDIRKPLLNYWDDIKEYSKESSHLVKLTKSVTGDDNWVKSLVIAHRMFQGTISVGYMIKEIEAKLERYGHRKKNKQDGADYKGLYHAKRLIYEATDIVTDNTIHLPFSQKRHNTLKKIRCGEVDVEKLGESISKDIEFLRAFDYSDDGRAEYIRDLTDRISQTIRSEIELYNLRNKE